MDKDNGSTDKDNDSNGENNDSKDKDSDCKDTDNDIGGGKGEDNDSNGDGENGCDEYYIGSVLNSEGGANAASGEDDGDDRGAYRVARDIAFWTGSRT